MIEELLPLVLILVSIPIACKWFLTIMATISDIDSKDVNILIEKYSLKRRKK